MRELAAEAGLADAVIVNTCAVTAEAVRKAKQEIRRQARDNPGAAIIVTRCTAQPVTTMRRSGFSRLRRRIVCRACRTASVVTAQVWSGKIQEKKSASQDFLPAPYQSSLNSFLRGNFALMANGDAALDQIRREWKGQNPENALRMHIGPVASGGASVVANKRFLDEVIKQHRKLVGVEMETYGVFTAAEESPFPTPKAFSIKSVSDFADEAKDDSFREYGAFTSASALKYFVERYIVSC